MYKADLKILKRGLRRMMLALLAALLFAIAVYGFISVVGCVGYLAVQNLILAVVALMISLFLLYTLGVR